MVKFIVLFKIVEKIAPHSNLNLEAFMGEISPAQIVTVGRHDLQVNNTSLMFRAYFNIFGSN